VSGATPRSEEPSPRSGPPLLEVDRVTVQYGRAVAVEDVSLRLMPGERVTLIGPNGAGKTSLLNAICGVLRPSSGRIRVDGRDVTGGPPGRLVGLGVVQAPEGRQVFPGLSVEANLQLAAFGRQARGAPISGLFRYVATRQDVALGLERVYEQLPRLRELRQRPAGLTSGGEQQMLAIGRALMASPRLLAIDELSLGLAPLIVEGLVEVLRQLNEAAGVAILLVEQNAELALELCPRAYVLEAGRCRAEGPSAELRERGLVEAAYLGDAP
jgi:branched-chain amino acid transport system ATP-binding protein